MSETRTYCFGAGGVVSTCFLAALRGAEGPHGEKLHRFAIANGRDMNFAESDLIMKERWLDTLQRRQRSLTEESNFYYENGQLGVALAFKCIAAAIDPDPVTAAYWSAYYLLHASGDWPDTYKRLARRLTSLIEDQ